MKKNSSKIIYCLSIIVAVALICSFIGQILINPQIRPCMDAVKAFHKLDSDSQDLIVLGSSHAWRGIDTVMLNEDYNIRSYNYGCNWQQLNTTQLFFHDALLTQKPKIMVIDTFYVGKMLKDTPLVGEVYYTRSMEKTPAKTKYLEECFGDDTDRRIGYRIPFVAFHSTWDELSSENFRFTSNVKGYMDSYGFSNDDRICPTQVLDYRQFWQEPLPDESVAILDDFVDTCRANDIQLILVTIPGFGSGEFWYNTALTDYAASRNISYINYYELLDELDISGENDFSDPDHFNLQGARKLTKFLGDYIKAHHMI